MPDELTIDSGALIFATLADVYLSSGMIDEAISILEDGLSRNPQYTLAKVILGRAYYSKNEIDKAIEVLEDAYKTAKNSENANFYLGQCYKKLGEDDKAIEFYEATLKINPNNEDARKELETLKPTPVQVEQPELEPGAEVAAPEEAEIEPAAPIVEEQEKTEIQPEPVIEAEEERVEAIALPSEQIEDKVEEISEPIGAAEKRPPEPEELAQPEVPFVPLEALNASMKRLLSIAAIKGAFISSKDGLLIQSYYKEEVDLEEMCAMIAAIHNEAEQSFKFLREGDVEKFLIEKENETICVMAVGESLLTIVTEPEAKPGLLYVYARSIINEIKEILG